MLSQAPVHSIWRGDLFFVLESLIAKDFKIRYRNMSFGVFWSILNPLIMMVIWTFVFSEVFASNTVKNYPIFILCGLIPFNFYSYASTIGTTCLFDNAPLIKRVPVPRELVPVASVLSNVVHLLITSVLLFVVALATGVQPSFQWLWIPLIWVLLIILVIGWTLFFSGIHLHIRDTRYFVESLNLILFWLVPIFYSPSLVPQKFQMWYYLNPLTLAVVCLRTTLIDGRAPDMMMMVKLALISWGMFLLGLAVFQRLKKTFYSLL